MGSLVDRVVQAVHFREEKLGRGALGFSRHSLTESIQFRLCHPRVLHLSRLDGPHSVHDSAVVEGNARLDRKSRMLLEMLPWGKQSGIGGIEEQGRMVLGLDVLEGDLDDRLRLEHEHWGEFRHLRADVHADHSVVAIDAMAQVHPFPNGDGVLRERQFPGWTVEKHLGYSYTTSRSSGGHPSVTRMPSGVQQPRCWHGLTVEATNMNTANIIEMLGAIAIGAVILIAFMRRKANLSTYTKKSRIVGLDLTDIREKAMKRNKWDEPKAKTLESEYRDFLILLAENDGSTISPWSDDLDLFWHEHILNTKKYAKDCKYLFGHLIHHDPLIERRPYHHEETRRTTIALREAQLKSRSERQKQAASGTSVGCSTGFDFATWGCSADDGKSHGSSHDSGGSHGHSCGGSHGGGHSCSTGHSCGGHSCGGHGCGGHGCGGGH